MLQIVLGLGLISLLVLCVAYQSVAFKLRSPNKSKKNSRKWVLPPVTVLKPLKGDEPGLEQNLRAILEQRHPNFEVIFGAEDPFDPGLAVARLLCRQFPHISTQIIGGGAPREGANPKVRILSGMVQFASHEWVLISDSNVRPKPDYLAEMCRVQLEEEADLVHTLLSGTSGESLGGRLEELQLGGWIAASISFAARFGHPCVIGKSMLLRRAHLCEEGALYRMRDVLAEDYMMGRELQLAGKKVMLASYRLPVVTGRASLKSFFNRHIRWGQMRRWISPGFFLGELIVNPTPFLLSAAVFARHRQAGRMAYEARDVL